MIREIKKEYKKAIIKQNILWLFGKSTQGEWYYVIASDGLGWDHVSVSHKHKIPSWKVMCEVKDMFFNDEDIVMQLHPKKSEYVNDNPNCLHLWRPQDKEIPTPKRIMV